MKIDMVGKVCGRLTVVGQDRSRDDDTFWICNCECGNIKSIRGTSLRSGVTSSCGCLARENTRNRSLRHGGFGTGAYQSWAAMLQRCRITDPNHPTFKDYAGKGITFDPRWIDFVNFYDDMGDRPDGCTIDRIDSSKGYYKENCRWATLDVQANNKKNARLLTFNGKTQTLEKWAQELKIAKSTIHCRLRDGRTVEESLFKGKLSYGSKKNRTKG